jgi:UDP-2,3-diacylglucosamine hydrolase
MPTWTALPPSPGCSRPRHTLIHGHTHRPADHPLAPDVRRVVLSDWDAAAHPPRADVLRLTPQGLERVAIVPT